MTFPRNISTCHRCDRLQPNCAGACACTVDGRDIIAHAQANACPLGRFTPSVGRVDGRSTPRPTGLGDVAAKLAHCIGADRLARLWEKWTGKSCGCEERKRRINEWARRRSLRS